jgi:hypothetical protein
VRTVKRVIIESPYRAKTPEDQSANEEYLRECLLDSLHRGEAPFASHAIYTQVLDDADPVQRDDGMRAGWAWIAAADAVVVYLGRGLSSGMLRRISIAAHAGKTIIFRDGHWNDHDELWTIFIQSRLGGAWVPVEEGQ